MNGASDDLLARASFPLDQLDRIALRDDANLIQYIYERRAMTHDVVFDTSSKFRSSMVLYLHFVFFARGLGSVRTRFRVHRNWKLLRQLCGSCSNLTRPS